MPTVLVEQKNLCIRVGACRNRGELLFTVVQNQTKPKQTISVQ